MFAYIFTKSMGLIYALDAEEAEKIKLRPLLLASTLELSLLSDV